MKGNINEEHIWEVIQCECMYEVRDGITAEIISDKTYRVNRACRRIHQNCKFQDPKGRDYCARVWSYWWYSGNNVVIRFRHVELIFSSTQECILLVWLKLAKYMYFWWIRFFKIVKVCNHFAHHLRINKVVDIVQVVLKKKKKNQKFTKTKTTATTDKNQTSTKKLNWRAQNHTKDL